MLQTGLFSWTSKNCSLPPWGSGVLGSDLACHSCGCKVALGTAVRTSQLAACAAPLVKLKTRQVH